MLNQPDWYRSVLDNLSEGVYVTNRERKILYWNRTAEQMTGFAAEQVVGSFCYNNILMHVDEQGTSLCHTMCPLARTILDGENRTARVFLHHADGQRIPVIVRINPTFDADGQISGATELFSNDSASLSALERINELEKAAYLDPLTEVGNRRYTETALRKCLGETGNHHTPNGVLFLDVDNFKPINDTHGHLVGDRVLRMVAKTVQHNLLADDFVGRWGGDEFLVILHNVEAEKIVAVANKLRILINTAQLMLDESRVKATVSIGGTAVIADDSVEALLDRTDQALYAAKSAGRDRVKIVFPNGKI
ncbi:MAG TPA: diguanylate cyclase [Bellilinea sp.]|nr:diguanylate cyclase [Bellilinea sp.]